MCVKLVRAHIGPLQTLMTSQGIQGAGTHMDIEGRSRDSTVLTALTHTRGSLSTRQIEMLPFQPSQFLCWPLNGRPCHRHCLDLCTLLASAVFVWLPLHCIRAPFNQTGLRHAYCHQRSKGLRHPPPLSTPLILVSRPITGATTCPNRQSHNFTWSHY